LNAEAREIGSDARGCGVERSGQGGAVLVRSDAAAMIELAFRRLPPGP
jgi:hypothetical protein